MVDRLRRADEDFAHGLGRIAVSHPAEQRQIPQNYQGRAARTSGSAPVVKKFFLGIFVGLDDGDAHALAVGP